MKNCLFLLFLTAWLNSDSQVFQNVRVPVSSTSCFSVDTLKFEVLNNSGAGSSNLIVEVNTSNFIFKSIISNTNITLLASTATTATIRIDTLNAGAVQNISYIFQSSCHTNTGGLSLILKSSSGTFLNTTTSPFISVYKPSVGLIGLKNTTISPSNETTAGLLNNISNGQKLIREFRLTSANASASIKGIRLIVLNQFKYWKFLGVSKGNSTIVPTGDSIIYDFKPTDFLSIGNGDTIFDNSDGPLIFSDTMQLIGCNSDYPNNISLTYKSFFICGGIFCPSSELTAFSNSKAATDNVLIDANPRNFSVPTMCSNGPNDTTAKMSFRIRNSNNEAGVTGSGTIYDLVVRLGRGDYPFPNDSFVGNQNIKILAAKVNGQFVPYSRTTRYGVRIENLTAAQYTGGGLKDVDGDGYLDDLQKDSSVIVELYCNFRPAVSTNYGAYNLTGGSDRPYFLTFKSDSVSYGYSSDATGSGSNMLIAATQWKCNITFNLPCKDKSIMKTGYYLYSYWNNTSASSSLTPDFYNNQQNVYNISVREEYNYLNAYPRINNGSQYADSMISEFRVILPPGINLDSFSGKYGSAYNRTRVFQIEVNGPADYDTAIVHYARRSAGSGGAQDLQVYLKLDCSQLPIQCPNSDSLKWYSWQHIYPVSGATMPCHSTIVDRGFRPMRYHCGAYFKGLKMTSYDNKRMTMGVRKGDTSVNAQKIDPISAFANSDSVDRNSYLTYDTVLMQMKGVVTDTALFNPYVKVIIDKLNTSTYTYKAEKARTKVKIYDASTAMYRTFNLGYHNIVIENAQTRTLYIPLRQYVDSMRTFDPTYLIGGNVGSSVYSQDSVLIDFYYVVGLNPLSTDTAANTNREEEIFYTAEYRNDSLTGSRTCDLFSEYNKLIELFNYGYQQNNMTNGICNVANTVQVDFYFENRGSSGDPFPNEWHNNNYSEKIEYLYNPTLLSDPDSVYYTIGVYQEFPNIVTFKKLPANKYTISNGKFTVYPDSLLGGRKQQNLGPLNIVFTFYQQPTCAASGVRADFLGSVGQNTMNLYYNPHANSNLNISRIYARGSTAITNPIASNPIVASSNPASVNIVQTDTLTWTINYKNNSTNNFHFAWMDFRSPGLKVIKVTDISVFPNVNKPILGYTGFNSDEWSQLDTILAGQTKTYQVKALYAGCGEDTLITTLGYNCKYYPLNPKLGYLPPILYNCNSENRVLKLPVKTPDYQLQWAKVSEYPPAPITICDTITYVSRISNLNASDFSNIKLNISLPVSSSLIYISNSAMIQWPEGSAYNSLGVVPINNSGILTFDLSSKFRNGILPNLSTLGDSSKALIQLKFRALCPFSSGDQITMFSPSGMLKCGQTITGAGHASQTLIVNGVPTSPVTQLIPKIVNIDTFDLCKDTTLIKFRLYHRGGVATDSIHNVVLNISKNFQIDTNSIVVSTSSKFKSIIPSDLISGSRRLIQWNMSSTSKMTNGDSIDVSFKIFSTNQLINCLNKEEIKVTTNEVYNVNAACLSGGICAANYVISTVVDTLKLKALQLTLSNLKISSKLNPPFGERLYYQFDVSNNGTQYQDSVKFRFSGGALLDSALRLKKYYLSLSSSSVTISDSLDVPASKVCSLRVTLDSFKCLCSSNQLSTSYTPNIGLKDTMLCSKVKTAFGLDSVNSFLYYWSNGKTTSKIVYSQENIGPAILRDSIILLIDRNGCTARDTFLTTIHPLPISNTGPDTSRFICPGDSILIGTSSIGGYSYLWSPSMGLSSVNIAQPYAKPSASTAYILTVTNTTNGCKNYDTLIVNALNSSLTAQSLDYWRTCKGSSSQSIGGSPSAVGGIAPYSYLWTPATLLNNSNLANPILVPSINGVFNYILQVTDSKGCLAYDTTRVIIDTLPLHAAGRDTAFCKGNSVILGSTFQPKINYSWDPVSFLNSSTISNPIFAGNTAGLFNYVLTVSDSAGNCSLKDTLSIIVNPSYSDTINLSICNGSFYIFKGISRTLSGVYRDTLSTSKGCDSLVTLNLLVKDTSSKQIFDTICSNQIRSFNGINRTTTGIYKDTLINAQGCDSFLYLNLVVKPISNFSFNASICNNNPYNFNGQNLTVAGTYFDTLINSQGCDSFLTLNLSVSNTSSLTLNASICQGQFYAFNGQNKTTTGTYLDTLVNAKNCDSFLTLNLTVKDTSTKIIFDTICKNQTRTFNNQILNTTGIYKDTLTNTQGCDSFLYFNLLVKDTTSKQIFDTICSNQSKLFNGINRTTTGIYKDTLINAQGCDSFLYLNLYVKPISNYSFNASICNNNPYNFNGQNLTTAGTYFDTLINSQGCDSLLTLNLSVSTTSSHALNISICNGQFYSFNGQNRTTTGTYLDTLVNAKNCDSFLTLNLTVKDTSTRTIFDTICKNQTRTFNNQSLNTTGIYKDTLTNAQGCDSFLYLNLLVKDTSSKTIFDTICSNQSKLFNGINRTTTGLYKDTLTNSQGCDSFLYLNLVVKPISNHTFNASICNNNPYNFNGQNLTVAGTYYDTLINSQGCDSFLTLNLSVSTTSSHTLNISICQGQFYNFNGQNRTTSGTYLDTLVNAKNCDSFLTLNLTVKDTSTKIIYDTICKNQTRSFNNQTLNSTGIYKDTLKNVQGCDSFIYFNLLVKDTTSKQIFDTICSNQSKLFNGVNRTTTGIYKDTLINAHGCDSFLYLNLFVKPISTHSFNASICNNNPYNFNGQNLTVAGTYFDTLINSQGCDSFLTLNLSVSTTSSHTLNISICKGQVYNFNGQNRTTSGTYLDTLVNAKNCDSFLTLNLTVKDTSTKTIYDTICKNQTRSFNNQTLNTTGIYKDTLTNSQGCDSFLYLNLLVKDTSSKQIYDTICSNQSKLFNGINRTTTGVYKDTLTNAQGCDSFLYLNLFVKPISNYTFNASICNNNPYNFNGQNLTTAGTYFDTLTNSQGCDSFLTLNLSVSTTSTHTLNISICNGQVYNFNGQNRTMSGTYLDTLVNAKNCDSFLTLNLTVKDTSTKIIYDTICKNQTRSFNNQTLNTTGIYKDTLTNAQGCDSFLYLNLLVKDTSSKQIYDTICSNQSKLFNGINRTTTGIYKDTLINAQGCDSFLYLNLFVKPTSSYSFNASICNNNPYNFNGQNLTVAGTYYDTLINSQGCDSFLTLNLSVSTTSSHTLNISICQGQFYNFNGQNRTTSGTYLDTLVNAKNCDSFLTLNLTVKDTSTKIIYDTICKNQTRFFNNQSLNMTGIYKDTLTNSQGCDSFLYLNLLVKDTSSKQIFDTICSNQSKLFNGVNRSTTGIYKDTLMNSQGCDSFLYLNLVVKPISNHSFNASICNNNPYNFNGQNLTTAGTYFDTLINSQGCDSFLTLNLSVSTTSSHTLNISICKGQVYNFNGQNRTTSGTYLDTLVNAKNCDSFLNLNLTVKDTSTKMIYDTICKNQTRSFNNQTLSTTGIYKDTLVNSQGCDSFLYLNLLVKDTSSKTIYDTICSNQSKLFNGINRTTTGVYKDTLTNSQGCDSFLYLNLFVKLISNHSFNASICNNNPYNFNGQNLTVAGTYYDTLINSQGCDSFLTLNLSVSTTSSHTLNISICKGQVYNFNGQNRTTSGTYMDTLVNAKNCDSFLTLNLTVKDTSSKTIYDTICKNQTRSFNNQTLNTTGIYKDTLTNAQGCDSFLYLYLLVKDTSSKQIFDTICSNQSKLFNGVNRSTTGIYKDTLMNSQGCDSFLYLNLVVKPISNHSFNASICNNNPYNFNGQNLTIAGTYYDTLINSQGCDSFITLNLSVSTTSSHTLNISICKGQVYNFNGQNRTTSGTYLDTLVNAKNCDSFLTLNLTVKDTSARIIFDTICKNQTRNFNNQTINNTGIYKDTLTNAQGCDSFLYLNLLVKDTTSKTIFDTICSNQSILFNGINRMTTGIYKDTLINAQGCDSFIYLHLKVHDTTKKDSFKEICRYQSIVFNGQTLNTSGIYKDTFVNAKGCDSFLYLHLTVNDTTRKDSFRTICKNQSVVFNGNTINNSGVYRDTLVNVKGCDSFVYLHLTVNDTTRKDSFLTICKNQPVVFNNLTLNASGLYKDTLVNAKGCDSFVYLYLTVNDTTKKDTFRTICKNQPIVFNGNMLNTTGVYRDTFVNSRGCDSFLVLNLTVRDTTNYFFTKNICQGESYTFNQITHFSSGNYKDTATNAQGCDSFIYLNLVVNPLPIANAGVDKIRVNCKGDSAQIGLLAIPNIDYTWSPNSFISDISASQPWVKPITNSYYILKTKDRTTNCVNYDTVNVMVQNIVLSGTAVRQDLFCFNDNSGKVKINANGGYRPYRYWTTGKLPQADSVVAGLAAGLNTYYFEDAKGCEFNDTFSLKEPPKLTLTLTAKKNLKCYNENIGEIEVIATGGSGGNKYKWSRSSDTLAKAINLASGLHTVTVVDKNGCLANLSETLTQPNEISITEKIINNKCHGDSSASIELKVSSATCTLHL
jgi:hypothetical protein